MKHEDVSTITYVLLLLVNMTNLEPDIFLSQGARRVANNVFKALYKISHNLNYAVDLYIPPDSL
jgi:hypothetical protein